jgi:signal transduction histidine kinase
MFTSLRVRLFLVVSAVAAVAVITVYLFAGQGAARAVYGLAASTAERDQRLAAGLLQFTVPAGDVNQLQAEAERLGQVFEARILLASPQGVILVDSTKQFVGHALPVSGSAAPFTAAERVVFREQPAFLIMSYPPGDAAESVWTARLPAEAAAGWAQAAPPDVFISAPVQLARDDIFRSLLLAATAGGGVALVLTLVFARPIVEPIEALTAAARRLEKGDLSQRVSVRATDEIGALAHAFNAMADGLDRNEQLRRHMVTDIAHELRTPLTNLRGYLEAVRDGVVDVQPDVVQSLYEETMLLNRLVDDLQDLTLAEAGQLRMEKQPVSVAEVAARTAATLPLEPGSPRPSITLDIPEDVPPVLADPERLRQVLRNLLVNAVHHTPPDGEIVVSGRRAGSWVAIAVRDTGEGIAPEHLPFVFDRFYRADPSRARATGGAGLGLAIVRQLVEAHGGEVRAESVPGQGATFTVTVPAA